MADDFASRLHGIVPPVVTPLTEQRTLDAASAERLYRHMVESGVHGVFLFGSSGEGALLSEADRADALRIAVDVVGGRIPILVGLLEPGTDRVVAQGHLAKSLGADALVVCPPFYFPSTQDDVLEHFRAVRQEVGLPIVAYDIPVTTKVKIEFDTMLTLAGEGTIVGVKDSSGDAVGFRRLLLRRPAGFKLFTGSELLVDTVLQQGADGSVPGLANVAPELFVKLYDLWQAGRHAEALEVQNRIVHLFDVFIPAEGARSSGYAVGSMKSALKLRGVIETATTCRPFRPPTPQHEERTRSIMQEVGVL